MRVSTPEALTLPSVKYVCERVCKVCVNVCKCVLGALCITQFDCLATEAMPRTIKQLITAADEAF